MLWIYRQTSSKDLKLFSTAEYSDCTAYIRSLTTLDEKLQPSSKNNALSCRERGFGLPICPQNRITHSPGTQNFHLDREASFDLSGSLLELQRSFELSSSLHTPLMGLRLIKMLLVVRFCSRHTYLYFCKMYYPSLLSRETTEAPLSLV